MWDLGGGWGGGWWGNLSLAQPSSTVDPEDPQRHPHLGGRRVLVYLHHEIPFGLKLSPPCFESRQGINDLPNPHRAPFRAFYRLPPPLWITWGWSPMEAGSILYCVCLLPPPPSTLSNIGKCRESQRIVGSYLCVLIWAPIATTRGTVPNAATEHQYHPSHAWAGPWSSHQKKEDQKFKLNEA